jgi:hypothetical protein
MSSFQLFAYTDPGTGTLILQMVVAAVVGAMAFFRTTLWRFLGLFRRRKDDSDSADPAPSRAEKEDPRS